MNKFFASFMLTAVSLVTACSSNEEPVVPPVEEQQPEAVAPTVDAGPAISEIAAKSAAMQALSSFFGTEMSRADGTRIETINANGKPSLYVVEFEQGGYAVIDADSLAPVRVLAVAENGNCPEIGKSYLLSKKNVYSSDAYTITPPVIKPDLPLKPEPVKSDTIRALWRTPQWSQNAPYNKYCFTKSGVQSVAGSVAVAMATIMAYNQSPSKVGNLNINWSQVWPNGNSNATDVVAQLMAEIGRVCGFTYKNDYVIFRQSSIVAQLEKFGFTAAKSTNKISEVLNLVSPAIAYSETLDGEDWTWVIDGRMKISTYVPGYIDVDGNPTPGAWNTWEYLHFNWGLDGECDGWYLADSKWYFESDDETIYLSQNSEDLHFIVNL